MSDVKFLVTVDSKKGTAAIKKLDDNIDNLGKSSKKAAPAISGMWKQMAAGVAVAYGVIRSIRGLTQWMGDAITKAGEQELAEKEVKAALESTGREVESNTEHYKQYASAIQAATTYGDEQVLASQAMLIQLTGLKREGIDAATRGAIGLASVYKTDLKAATVLVGKALAGNYGALSRYGIMVDRTMTDEEKRASILEQLEVMYKRAEAETDTYQGAIKQLKNTYGDLKEEIGKAVTENEDFRDLIKSTTQLIRDFIDSGAPEQIIGFISQFVNKLITGEAAFKSLVLIAMWLHAEAIEAKTAAEETKKFNENIETMRRLLAEMQAINAEDIPLFTMPELELKIPETLKKPKELLEGMGLTKLGPEFEYEWGIFEASYDEKMNAYQNSLMESLDLGLINITGLTEEATTQQLTAMDKIQTAMSWVAGFSKETAIASALVNTYQGASKTIAMLGMPWALPFVALAIASGLKQVAAIKSQSIPSAAEGGDVVRTGFVNVHAGEIIRQPSALKETFREVIREGGGSPIYITLENHMAGEKVSKAHWKITNEGFKRGKIKVRNIQ